MSELLTKQGVVVSTENDVVVLCIGRARVRMSYFRAFKMAQRLRIASKIAMRCNGEAVKDHRKIAAFASDRTVARLHEVQRRSRENPTLRNFEVNSVGELVDLRMGNVTARFEYRTGLQLAAWLRSNGKNAKRWAGDVSKQLVLVGHLSDAEKNYAGRWK